MMIMRPIRESDYPALYEIAVASGHGFTSLPADEALLREKIARSEAAFACEPSVPGNENYLFVMEDSATGAIVGTSGIRAAVGWDEPVFHYRLGKVAHASRDLGIYNTVETLTLGNDYMGSTELCSLFLHSIARGRANGRLLSRFRFLFIAEHPQGFSNRLIANMRGVCDSDGHSPFWAWLQQHFFSIDFSEAVRRVGLGQKGFVAELMPKYPIYVDLLGPAAKAVIGQVHEETVPAVKLLQAEGFSFRGRVDIFDAGPVLEAERDDIRSIKHSRQYCVEIGKAENPKPHIVCNTARAGFRATLGTVHIDPEHNLAVIDKATATALNAEDGQTIRAVPLDHKEL